MLDPQRLPGNRRTHRVIVVDRIGVPLAMPVIAKGPQITVKLNGQTIVDANLDEVKDPRVRKRHPGLSRLEGHIGFLGHGTRVEFRNIRIKELK